MGVLFFFLVFGLHRCMNNFVCGLRVRCVTIMVYFFSFLFSMARICVSVYLSVKQSVAAEQLNNNRPVWAGFGPS